MSELETKYETAKDILFNALAVVDTYVDNLHKPQLIRTSDWSELENSPGVWIKSITLHQPSTFALALVHGYQGAQDLHHKLTDNVEVHVITGKLALNDLEFTAGDRIFIPAGKEYSFEYLDDTYLTAKFIPAQSLNPINFTTHGSNITTENTVTPPEVEARGYADSQGS